MSSTITTYSTSINIVFPIQGQDNDTQGFRDNYSLIRSALNVAATEITDIQSIQSNTQVTLSTLTNLVIGNIQSSSTSILITNNTIAVNNTNSLYAVYSLNPTDSISTITNGTNGQLIYIRALSENQVFSITTSGNISSTGTIISSRYSPLIYDTSKWYFVGNI
jgi:hypothetical protein